MDPRFLGFYERELKHVRELGGEFARAFPKIAGRLGLDAFGCADPYVERLIEAFAFLTARVQQKLAAEQGEFTQQMLDLLYPSYLAPTPSMAVVQLTPDLLDSALSEGVLVPRGAALRSPLGEQQTACEYRTAHPVTLWPIELESADYRTNLAELLDVERVAMPAARAALRIVLRCAPGVRFDELPLDTLPLFLRGGGEVAMRLYEQLLGTSIGMVVQSSTRPHTFMEVQRASCVAPLGFEADEALLPAGERGFDGYRLLHEFFVFPERFMFAELRSLRPLLARTSGDRIELVVLFDRADPRLDGVVRAAHFSLFCTPIVNLFPRKSDRLQLSERDYEHHVVPDRARPLDFEVHSITELRGHGPSGDDVPFLPMYAPDAGRARGQARYTLRRQPRAMTHTMLERDGSVQAPYVPAETFVSLVDGEHGAHRASLTQLSVSALCTNRALPLSLAVGKGKTDFIEQSGAPLSSVRCVAGPTAPRSSPVHGDLAWGLLSHLSLDYLALMQRDGSAAGPLRELLGLYARFADRSGQAQIEGIVDVQTQGVVRPLPFAGPLTFGRGIEVTLTCDERAYPGSGAFLLGAVLTRFFAKYASINSFTETVLCTQQRGEVMRWPVTPGRRSTV
jgi:type VI secretion system protein ImpG